jgi:hypothetical protein
VVPHDGSSPDARLMTAMAAGRRVEAVALRSVTRLVGVRPLYVLGSFIVAEWIATLGLALNVRHNGWLYYQGGDQIWFYTTSWLLRHGQLPPTAVGYGESVLLMPFTLFSDANLLHVLPGIVLLNVLVLMPVALLAMYGIGERLGGRLFGYWVALLWIVLPYVGIKYADAGFHQRYTEAALPQSLGLTAMSDFPSMVMLAVGAYFVIRALQSRAWIDGFFAGSFVGFGIGIKPSSSLCLGGLALALVVSRRWRIGVAVAAGLAPPIVALTFWKWRGLGHIPLLSSTPATRLALATGNIPLPDPIHRYVNLDWSMLGRNLASLQEHFWSARLVEWLVVAGILGIARLSRPAACLAGTWFLAFVLIKGSGQLGSLEDGSLLRMLIPAIPAFVLLMASIPLLLPGLPGKLRPRPARAWGSPQQRLSLAIAGTLLFAAVPTALAGLARPLGDPSQAFYHASTGLVPTALPIKVRVHGNRVTITWHRAAVRSASTFYVVLRALPSCLGASGVTNAYSRDYCLTEIAELRQPGWSETLSPGPYAYRITESANWRDDPLAGDPYLASPAVSFTIR